MLSAGPAMASTIVGTAAALPSINMQQQQHSSAAPHLMAMCTRGAYGWCGLDGGCQRALLHRELAAGVATMPFDDPMQGACCRCPPLAQGLSWCHQGRRINTNM